MRGPNKLSNMIFYLSRFISEQIVTECLVISVSTHDSRKWRPLQFDVGALIPELTRPVQARPSQADPARSLPRLQTDRRELEGLYKHHDTQTATGQSPNIVTLSVSIVHNPLLFSANTFFLEFHVQL